MNITRYRKDYHAEHSEVHTQMRIPEEQTATCGVLEVKEQTALSETATLPQIGGLMRKKKQGITLHPETLKIIAVVIITILSTLI